MNESAVSQSVSQLVVGAIVYFRKLVTKAIMAGGSETYPSILLRSKKVRVLLARSGWCVCGMVFASIILRTPG